MCIYIYVSVALNSQSIVFYDNLMQSFKELPEIIGHARMVLRITRRFLATAVATPMTKPNGITDFLCALLVYKRKWLTQKLPIHNEDSSDRIRAASLPVPAGGGARSVNKFVTSVLPATSNLMDCICVSNYM